MHFPLRARGIDEEGRKAGGCSEAELSLGHRFYAISRFHWSHEVSRAAPYMHDGSVATLEDVVEFYSQGGRSNPELDPRIRPIRFTPEEKRALVAFLQTRSGRISEGF